MIIKYLSFLILFCFSFHQPVIELIFKDYLSKYKIIYDSYEDYQINLENFKQQYLNSSLDIEKFFNLKEKKLRYLDTDYPEYFNWVEEGAVNEIQNQGICGSSSVFSTMTMLEGYYYIKNKKLLKLSEQYVIDCFIIYGDICLNGSHYIYNFNFIKNYNPMLDYNYPYISKDKDSISQFCKYNISKIINLENNLKLYSIAQKNDTMNIINRIYNYGPIGTRVNGSCNAFLDNFNNSKYIIYSDNKECEPIPNHAINIVGWGLTEKNNLYWIVRNSWGKEWGDEGYGYVLAGYNSFGIENELYYIKEELITSNSTSTNTDNTCKNNNNNNYYLKFNLFYIMIILIL